MLTVKLRNTLLERKVKMVYWKVKTNIRYAYAVKIWIYVLVPSNPYCMQCVLSLLKFKQLSNLRWNVANGKKDVYPFPLHLWWHVKKGLKSWGLKSYNPTYDNLPSLESNYKPSRFLQHPNVPSAKEMTRRISYTRIKCQENETKSALVDNFPAFFAHDKSRMFVLKFEGKELEEEDSPNTISIHIAQNTSDLSYILLCP